ncbi:MAG: discoidin domain-containing protein, partial [Bifidobacteriaceae bacterium]|nr:discoidin domain-containing protein [Bifidobacteriaceae bacterium]
MNMTRLRRGCALAAAGALAGGLGLSALPVPAPAQAAQAAIGNLALGKPVYANSNNLSGFKERAVDGDTSTHWTTLSAMRQAWIYVDLEDVYALAETRVLFNMAAPGGLYKYQIEGSNDAEEWDVLADRSEGVNLVGGDPYASGGYPNLDEWQADEVEGDYRYVRLSIVDSGANDWPSIYELEVSGDGIPATVASVGNPPGLTVRLGRAADSLNLPAQVTVTDGGGRQAQAGVVWDTSAYDPAEAGVYNLAGTLVGLPDYWSNPGSVVAVMVVTVADIPPIADDQAARKLTLTGDRYQMVVDYDDKAKVTSLVVDGLETLGAGGIVSTVQFRAASTNLALGKAVAVSTTAAGADYAKEHAVDGDTASRWVASGGGFPQWLTVDLGAQYSLGTVRQLFHDNDESTYKFKVEGSNTNNGTDWVTLADHTVEGLAQPGLSLADREPLS